ncbi:MAG: gamma-glutamyl-gamma-aminobutyrate hydrolase family protein [Acidimicrobiales bacterium]|nr:gamma-glutamyl-gamma-aminobutyrate hydrolase family protein [Acidimicrobiales bacterium]MCB9372279.1 gamma-glutamyl-gamma-aminobutyrate hydrolase family protein [Microthrixaceae bacterium]
MSDRPRIGITSWPRDVDYEGTPERCDTYPHDYVHSVIAAGGLPLLLPLNDESDDGQAVFAELLDLVDGVVLTGGGDIEPAAYGAGTHEATKYTDAERDAWDTRLMHQVVERRIPTLGICRGLQVANVALGGTLVQHLDGHDAEHLAAGDAHAIAVEPGSRLASLLGAGESEVNSLHHQAVDRLGPGIRAVATSPDGVVEAIELEGSDHFLAVQWHPELLRHRPDQLGLFRDLVHRSRASRTP